MPVGDGSQIQWGCRAHARRENVSSGVETVIALVDAESHALVSQNATQQAVAPQRTGLTDVPQCDGTDQRMRLYAELCDSLRNKTADGAGFFRRGFAIRLDSWGLRCNPSGSMELRVSGSVC
jgi:hypothetical protein